MITSEKTDTNVQKILEQRARELARVITDDADQAEGLEMLVFKLADEKYAIDINFVKEIQSLCGLAPLVGVPPYWAGLINLRGRLVPVLDMRSYLGLGRYVPEDRNRNEEGSDLDHVSWDNHPGDGRGQIVYMSTTDMVVGVLVNQAQDVKKINREDIHTFLKDDPNRQSRAILGVTSDFVTVLDGAQLFSELSVIGENT